MNKELEMTPNVLVEFLQKPASEFTKEDIIRYIYEKDIQMVNFMYPAGDGRLKTLNFVINNAAYLDAILTCGERVDGSSLFSFIEAGSSDLYVVPRFRTAFEDPFAELPTLTMLCSFFNKDGEPLESSPEYTLHKACKAFHEVTGMDFEAMGELEYYVIAPDEGVFPATDQKGYHESAPYAKFNEFRTECMHCIAQAGGQIKYGHSEVGNFTLNGLIYEQNEIEFLPCPAENAADQLMIAKWAIRNLAHEYGYNITFAPKITAGKAGSGLHIHMRIMKDGKNQMLKDGVLSETARKAIHDFINDEPDDVKVYEMEHPDVLLWAVWCIQQYAKMVSRDQCREKYGTLLQDIMEYLRRENHPNLFLHSNGLLYANGTEKAITWMNSTANGRPVIPRTGYIVEINALWYNALRFTSELLGEGGNNNLAETLNVLAEKTGKAFVDTFLNEYGYLLDYVDGNMMDWSVRPNMIFTVAFDYSPLDARQKKGVLDIVTKELLTPKGLRSLSPKSGGYNPNYVGPQMQRDYAYHQGTAWPWLAGFYFEAYLRIYKMSGIGFVERQLIGYEDEMTSHCIGSIPELFDGNPPFKGRGAVSFAMNVAEILRVLYLLSKYNY